jgi:hypothetical protein
MVIEKRPRGSHIYAYFLFLLSQTLKSLPPHNWGLHTPIY